MPTAAEKKQNTGDPTYPAEGLDVSFKGHANVTRSRLDDGSDMQWRGKRKFSKIDTGGKHKRMM